MKIGSILFAIIGIILLSACAHDNYTVIPDSGGSKEAMAADLKACKDEATHKYFDGRSNNGSIVGATFGGAIGGALGGALDASNNTGTEMKLSDINPYVGECMRKKGYEGTSS